MNPYQEFINSKSQLDSSGGFDPVFMPDFLFDFQQHLVEWSIRTGRDAILADCGLGKTPMELVWAENVVRHANGNVLIVTALAVGAQMVLESVKFGIEAKRSSDGIAHRGITITNYEQLHKFNPNDFVGCVCDECFPHDTEIDVLSIDGTNATKYIKDIRTGDRILNASGVDVVSDVHRREVQYAVKTHAAGRVITSSPNHPYFTQRGWVGAIDLRAGDYIMETAEGVRLVQDGFHAENSSGKNAPILRSILLSEMEDAPAGSIGQGTFSGSGEEAWRKEIGVVQDAGSRERIGENNRPESHEESSDAGQGEPQIESHEARTFRAWGERERIDRAANNLDGCVIADLDSGISFVTGPIESGIPDALQAGLGLSRHENRNRGGWELALQPEGIGREEERYAGFARVDCVEILEQGHPDLEKYRDASGKLYFYDLGGTRHPSFSIGGLLVHNSSILKSFSGARRIEITVFMRKMKYRLLATATAAPNDYLELGTSSEALGYLGHMDMLARFFKNDLNNSATGRMRGDVIKWRFKGHAELPFWKWVCSWARAVRKPSDIGFDDARFVLPALVEREHLVRVDSLADGMLFALPAVGLKEQREERRRTVTERCEKVASLLDTGEQGVAWCHLNEEGDMLEQMIPDAIQVSGKDSDAAKEEKLLAFSSGQARVMVTKQKICGWGLNWQQCHHTTIFPSHSFEAYYQSIRRFWRFGQAHPVKVDIVTTEGELGVLKNLQRKAAQADRMFSNLVAEMNASLAIDRASRFPIEQEPIPWL